jgi:hypothetical protein
METGWQHPAVVDHQEVALVEESGKVAKAGMVELIARAVNHEESRAIAFLGGMLGDQLVWEFVIKVVGSHVAAFGGMLGGFWRYRTSRMYHRSERFQRRTLTCK